MFSLSTSISALSALNDRRYGRDFCLEKVKSEFFDSPSRAVR